MKRSYDHLKAGGDPSHVPTDREPGPDRGRAGDTYLLLKTVAASNFDAQAERIHWTGLLLLPPSINSTALTDALLAIKQQTGQIATQDCVLMPS